MRLVYLFIYFWPCLMAYGILVPRPGVKSMAPAVEAWSPTGPPGNFQAWFKKRSRGMPQSPTPGREVPFTRASERLPLSQVLKHHFQLRECQLWGQGSLSPPPAPLWLWPAMPPLQPPCPLHASSEDLRLCVGRPLHQ